MMLAKWTVRIGLLAAALLALTAAPALAEDPPHDGKLNVTNNTPATVRELYASPAGADRYGEDLLGQGILAAGASIVVQAGPPNGPCRIDLKGVLTSGVAVMQRNIDICRNRAFSFTAPAGVAQDDHDRNVSIANASSTRLTAFYFKATTSGDWRANALPEGLATDGTQRLNIDDGSTTCRFDFKAVFADGRTVIRQDINVCEVSNYRFGNAGAGSGDGQDRKVKITNDTSGPVRELVAAVTGTTNFKANMLTTPLAPGASVTIDIDDGEGHCRYDLKAVPAMGAPVTHTDVNVCQISEYSVAAGVVADAEGEDGDSEENREVEVKNEAGAALLEFYFAPTGQADMGPNRVTSPVAARSGWHVDINDGQDHCDYDLKAVFEGGKTVVLRGVNACRVSEVRYFLTPRGVVGEDDLNRDVRVFNDTANVLARLCASAPGEAVCRGNLLGNARLRSAMSEKLTITDGTGRCIYDLHAEFQGAAEIVEHDVNVCEVAVERFAR